MVGKNTWTMSTLEHALAGVIVRTLGNTTGADLGPVCTDSRQVRQGSVFVALKGERFDGHDYAAQAARDGASVVVVERDTGASCPQIIVRDTQEALGALARAWRSQFAVPVICVAGSNGKTTTTQMIASILRSFVGESRVVATEKNYNNHIGAPLTLLRLTPEHRAAVIETGMNHFGEIRYLGEMVRPDIAVITNVGDAHIENLGGTRAGTLRAKSEIFENLSPDGIAVLNGDDELLNTVTLPQIILRCGEGPTVAMRFDIDALGVFEEHDPSHRPAKEGFNSVNEGFMHACGHDGHATIGLGVAKVLMSIKDQLHGTVKLIFQPAEEGVRGAKSIVDNGHLDGVDYLIGSHVTNKKEDDPAVVIPGSYGSLATTKYDVIFHGKSAHAGGSPEVGRNVMLAVGTAILNLYSIPRHSGGVSRVNVGTVVAGSGRNVIADEAKMEIEVRGETTEINEYMKNYAVNIIESAAKMHGCTCEMKLMGAANSLASSEALMERVKRVCEEDLHLPVAKEMSSKNGGSEDVSYMMNRVQEQGGQATFMRVLTHEAGPGHSRIFDIDEQVLPNAVKIFCGVVYDIMH